jgi:hypothetical protein
MSDTPDVLVVEMVAYDPVAIGTTTLRYATQGFATLPTDTPASTYIDGRLRQPLVIRRDLFKAGTTRGRSSVTVGDLDLVNDDGALDDLLTYGFSGRAITLWRGAKGAAFPSGFSVLFAGTMEQPEATLTSISVKVRDRMMDLLLPLQATKYAGSNVLPAGLEGTADDLKGKPKPFCLGSVLNVPAVCVNTSKLIYQVNDGAIQSLDAVYDRGISLGTTVYAWTSAAWGITTCQGIAYGAGLWVAVGDAGKVYTSPDGITWTSRTSTFGASAVNAIVWSGTQFVIVGIAGKCATSPDGITWTSRTSSFGAVDIWGVTYGNGVYVATGAQSASIGTIASSTDGITWTQRTSNLGNNPGLCTTFGGGVFVVGGQGGKVVSSTDGTTWTLRTVPFTAAQAIIGATWGDGVFVLVGTAGVVATSVNGVDWIQRYLGGLTTVLSCVTYGAGYYVAGGASALFVSTDAVSWLLVNTGDTYTGIATNGLGGFVAAGSSALFWSPTVGGGTYANTTDLQDDTLAPAAGTWKVYKAGGYFRLGSPPAGLVTADVSQGATAADRTAGQLFSGVLTKAGKSAGTATGNWKAADITTLDGAFAGVCGYWTDEEATFADVLDMIAMTAGAWWGADMSGVYRIKQLLAPSGTPVLDLTNYDLLKDRPLNRLATNDDGRGLPSWRTIVRYARNYAVQDTDVAGGVTDARRAFLKDEWREAKDESAAVQTIHLLAVQTVEDSLLYSAADAVTEAARRQTLRGTLRHRYATTIPLNDDTKALDLGDVVSITHTRFGLTGGPSFRILSIEPNVLRRELAIEVWK